MIAILVDQVRCNKNYRYMRLFVMPIAVKML